ncbi:hypothetical protein C882_1116 [Caenispirillum salinarum AK4]|uniref:Uncharacterized protein n=1 Tax=Caenispirillum salinarum AK4 TaxID=1238182 RepID=K9GQA0_9PROT|nr:hypothetical protein C882_1116 [Caenispirillum salinarum AK4]
MPSVSCPWLKPLCRCPDKRPVARRSQPVHAVSAWQRLNFSTIPFFAQILSLRLRIACNCSKQGQVRPTREAVAACFMAGA